MSLTKIYKLKILKEEKKLYDLWWSELIKLQRQKIKVIKKFLEKYYLKVLEELKNNNEIKANDLIGLKKWSDVDFYLILEELKDLIIKWYEIGAKQLDKILSNKSQIQIKFWVKINEIDDYAEQLAWSRITNIDNYTRQRINKILADWIKDGLWYDKIAEILKNDYWFSDYRARLIASNEVWNSYLQGKKLQFEKYLKEYWEQWRKRWVAHNDDRTTDWCRVNHEQWWIRYQEEHSSWHNRPPRFPWCRCNEEYSLIKPE